MVGSFAISNKVVWRFNGEIFVKQIVKLVPSVKLLFLSSATRKVDTKMVFIWKWK